jgi:CheY-like chemotaxis protein
MLQIKGERAIWARAEYAALPGGIRMHNKDSTLSGIKILVVDDDPDVLAALTLILRHYDAEVIPAAKPQEGLEQVKKDRPDVIISDIGMPHMDGYQFIRGVRKLPPQDGGHTPAIAVTAFNHPEDRIRVSEAGFQGHLSKPVDLYELITTIAMAAGREPHG